MVCRFWSSPTELFRAIDMWVTQLTLTNIDPKLYPKVFRVDIFDHLNVIPSGILTSEGCRTPNLGTDTFFKLVIDSALLFAFWIQHSFLSSKHFAGAYFLYWMNQFTGLQRPFYVLLTAGVMEVRANRYPTFINECLTLVALIAANYKLHK